MNTVVERRAPKNGYDNDEKQKYRHNVWRLLSEKCLDRLNESDDHKVLLLPSKEGIEIDVAISYGIKPDQIVAIDENPAVIAVSKWRKKHPEVKYFGKKVSEIGKAIEEKGWVLVAANLDFCNNFSAELIQEVNGFFEKTPVTKDFSFFVTMAKGRESSALAMLLKEDGVPDVFMHPRIGTLYKMMGFPKRHKINMAIDFQGQYISNRVPMLYACFSFKPTLILKAVNIHRREYAPLFLRYAKVDEYYIEGKKWDDSYIDKKNKKEKILSRIKNQIHELSDSQKDEFSGFCCKHNIINTEDLWSSWRDAVTCECSYNKASQISQMKSSVKSLPGNW